MPCFSRIADSDGIILMRAILTKKKIWEDFVSSSGRILHHLVLAGLSIAVALSLPWALNFVAKKVLIYWAMIGNEKLFVACIELLSAILLTLLFKALRRSWKDRRLSNMAKEAGLVLVEPEKGFFSRRRIKHLKEKQGFAKDVMLIGSTGYRTFVDPDGDLHQVIRNCRKTRILLLNPFSEGAEERAKSILDPNVTVATFREQIKKSIIFLKDLKDINKEVELKLYPDPPLLKVVILDDYVWIQHYHAGLDVQAMPECVFKQDQNLGSLYTPFYRYFMIRWNSPAAPEYDLESDELVYRDGAGNEIRRERFDRLESETNPRIALPPDPFFLRNDRLPGRVIYPIRQNRRSLHCIEEAFKNVW